ncbi:hypothetical protein [Bradyrhizobium sp. LB13.1]
MTRTHASILKDNLIKISLIVNGTSVTLPYSDLAASITTLKSLKLDVPTSDTMFPAGPGSDAINNNYLACHSADHVLNLVEWAQRKHVDPSQLQTSVRADDPGVGGA